ncbi:hypothetical protein CQW23_06783 [Capsicum baccatum]|uniref:Uncharacterized protein n=1 Tax=Capsicum baccatum TaxID=33114 RepID=A0A2G2X4C7_CAPBA|nr:hypothetical protein CQW23_06783 [Capsicum baccatum]
MPRKLGSSLVSVVRDGGAIWVVKRAKRCEWDIFRQTQYVIATVLGWARGPGVLWAENRSRHARKNAKRPSMGRWGQRGHLAGQTRETSKRGILGQIGHLQQFHHHNLEYLDLKFNFLQGPLPSAICNMSSLTFLDLSHNYFSHSVPSCLGSIGYIKVLNLRRNNFTGSLPPLCAQSTSLSTIALNGNRFEGTLPVPSFNCVGLEVLDLGNNTINDMFPAWLGTLEELQVLMLKSNKFPWTYKYLSD